MASLSTAVCNDIQSYHVTCRAPNHPVLLSVFFSQIYSSTPPCWCSSSSQWKSKGACASESEVENTEKKKKKIACDSVTRVGFKEYYKIFSLFVKIILTKPSISSISVKTKKQPFLCLLMLN